MEQETLNAQIEEKLRHPAPGSAIEAAQQFGVNLTLILERLWLTPAQRVANLQQAMIDLANIRGLARKTTKNSAPSSIYQEV